MTYKLYVIHIICCLADYLLETSTKKTYWR